MKIVYTLVAVAAAALVLAATSQAQRRLPHAKPFSRMTLAEKSDYLSRQVWHDRTAIRWLRTHDRRQLSESRSAIRWFRVSLRIAGRHLAAVRAELAASLRPAHHALWMCIHSHEASDWGNRDTGGNGHYGGLQMHPGWGYGTSEYASADSQAVQEAAAERGYRASGYSRSWLLGQWYHPDCLAYA